MFLTSFSWPTAVSMVRQSLDHSAQLCGDVVCSISSCEDVDYSISLCEDADPWIASCEAVDCSIDSCEVVVWSFVVFHSAEIEYLSRKRGRGAWEKLSFFPMFSRRQLKQSLGRDRSDGVHGLSSEEFL